VQMVSGLFSILSKVERVKDAHVDAEIRMGVS
jgi:hypothetical protein